MKKSIGKILFLFILMLSISSYSAFAIPQKITPVVAPSAFEINFAPLNNESISGFAISNNSSNPLVLLTGTTAAANNPLFPTPTLGGSDGFVLGYSKDGVLKFATRLGGASDDIATAITALPDNTFLVAGVSGTVGKSADSSTSTTTSSSTSTNTTLTNLINPDNINQTPVNPNQTLNQLNLWKVDLHGNIISTQSILFPEVVFPKVFFLQANNIFLLGEMLQKGKVINFSLPIRDVTSFEQVIKNTAKFNLKYPVVLKGKGFKFVIYDQTSASPNLPRWRPKRPLGLVEQSLGLHLTAAYYTASPIINYQLGKKHTLFLLTGSQNKYEISIIS